MMRFIGLLFLFLPSALLKSQELVRVQLPEMEIYANQLLEGDGDTYGLGTFSLEVYSEIQDSLLVIHAQILFEEGQNDHTRIFGTEQWSFPVKRLSQCQSCGLKLRKTDGELVGKNIGARGFKRWSGTGLIQSALIQTDTFGSDTGNVGGRFLLRPIEIEIYCEYVILMVNDEW
jgi:hypothetical protein